MSNVSLRSLLEAGAHFGHKKERSHPATRRFVYTVKEGILVINVEKTVEYLEEAVKHLKKTIESGGIVLFVGTKPQASEATKRLAQALDMPYVKERWLGGTLTNFETIKKSLFQLEELEKKMNDPSFEKLTKRERLHVQEKQAKLTETFEGILKLGKLPQALFVVDPAYEDIAVGEARRLKIPVFAILDTNANPDLIDYPIPANDESKRAIELILGAIADELESVKVKGKEGEREAGKERVVEATEALPKVEQGLKKAKKAAPRGEKVIKKVTKKSAKKLKKK